MALQDSKYFFDRVDAISGNLASLQAGFRWAAYPGAAHPAGRSYGRTPRCADACCVVACREAGADVLYTVIQSLTLDGRDRSLDYKLSGFHVPPGSADAQARAPGGRGQQQAGRLEAAAASRPSARRSFSPPFPQMLGCILPAAGEIVLPKTSSSVFSSTAAAYLLRNLGVRHLALCGCVTDQW